MAKPDKDDGFFQLAYELLASVMTADFTKVERYVLFEVFSQIYGMAKLPCASLSPREIARRTGIDPGSIGHAIADLVTAGVLVKGDDGYRYIKNYESWDFAKKTEASGARSNRKTAPKGEQPEHRVRRNAYVAHAPILVKSYGEPKSKHHRTRKPIVDATAEKTAREPLAPEPTSMLIGCWHQSQQSVGTRANKVLAPEPTKCDSLPISGEFRELERGKEEPPTPIDDVGVGTEESDGTPTLQPEKLSAAIEFAKLPIDPSPPHGYNSITPEARIKLDEARDLAIEINPDAFDVHRTIRDRDGCYPVEWYMPAAKRLRDVPRHKHSRSYFMGILRGFEGQGGPPAELFRLRESPLPTPAYFQFPTEPAKRRKDSGQ